MPDLPLPPVPPRLIGLDLDGTVLGDGVLGDAMLAALSACRSAGIELAFLTGRRPKATREALARYLDRAAICTNSGCLLWDYPQWEQTCAARLFPEQLLADVVDALAPWSLNLYHECGPDEAGRVFLLRDSTPEFEENRRVYGYNSAAIMTLDELDAVLDGRRIMQVALPGPRALAESLAPVLEQRFGSELLTLVVRWPLVPCHALELYHPEAHKGNALEQFAQRLGIPREAVVAVGDDTNDIPMLRWAGWAVAMPHSEDVVRAYADVMLNGEDGQRALADYLLRLAALAG